MKFDELTVGQTAEYSKAVEEVDIEMFAAVTGDFNPVHMDEAAAAKTRFGGRIAHGMISAGLISAAIASRLPGEGSIYLGQTLKFTAPVRIGDTITVSLCVLELMTKKRVRLSTTCRNQNAEIVVEGEATILMGDQ